ncbi:MAG: hypothetical protein MJ162_08220 [Treponema sp.]|nr:hypothetical protein [Treponema sp.]
MNKSMKIKKIFSVVVCLSVMLLITGCPVNIPDETIVSDFYKYNCLTEEELTARLNEKYSDAKFTLKSSEYFEDAERRIKYRKVILSAEGLTDDVTGYDYLGYASDFDELEYFGGPYSSRMAYCEPLRNFISCDYFEVKYKDEIKNDLLDCYWPVINDNPFQMFIKFHDYDRRSDYEINSYVEYKNAVANSYTAILLICQDFNEEGFERKYNSTCYDLYNSTDRLKKFTNTIFFFARPDVYNSVEFTSDNFILDDNNIDGLVRKDY